MQTNIEAIYEKGVLRPDNPLDLTEGTRVSLLVSTKVSVDDGDDLEDLLDHEYIAFCKTQVSTAPSLEEVREALRGVMGCLSDTVAAERDER